MRAHALAVPLLFAACAAARLLGGEATATLHIDAAADRRPINPEIYGVAFASTADLQELNTPLNRYGGNHTSRYNWKLNADNRGFDWFFESIPLKISEPGAEVDGIIARTVAAGGRALVTIPANGWVAKIGPNRERLWSYSVTKYGAQTRADPETSPDAGNGVRACDGQPIRDNDPLDANQPATPEFQRGWIEHLTARWGRGTDSAIRCYLLDNEPSIWHETHRDLFKVAPTSAYLRDALVDTAMMIRKVDPAARIGAPQEWGWDAFFHSSSDREWAVTHGREATDSPDTIARGGMDYFPWLLRELAAREKESGVRLLDMVTFHWYPQGGEYSGDVSPAIQRMRNRSTRIFWDPGYTDPTWVNGVVRLIPRLRELVAENYPGRTLGITEYNWGAEGHINGATAQADILGLFGREGLDLATRWMTPPGDSPTFKVFQLYRNYDGRCSTFGDTAVRLTNSADSDELSAFAAERSSDGALTLMVVAKSLENTTELALEFPSAGPTAGGGAAAGGNVVGGAALQAQVWQLTAANRIERLADVPVLAGKACVKVPAQSVTLLVLPKPAAK